jgi:predicted restriction endonuclease
MYYDRKDDYMFVRWAQAIKKRDHYSCQLCGQRGVYLNAHHIKSWNSNPEDRYDIDNGVTLCQSCHDRFHEIYGHGNNDEIQFEEFRVLTEELISLAEKNLQVERSTEKALRFLDGYTSDIKTKIG